MSKMDDMRAMREARYQRAGATPPRTGQPAKAPRPAPVAPAAQDADTPARRSTARTKAAAPPADDTSAPPTTPAAEGRCGHRAISGRTCTREQGHAAKSHRYS